MPREVNWMFNYLVIVICLIFSAFFSASEIAFASSNEIRLKHAAEEKKSLAAKLAYKIYLKFESALVTILIGNNLVNIAASSVATVIVVSLWGLGESWSWLATVILTLLLLVFGEIGPKVIAKTIPETFATLFSIPLRVIMIITKPIVFIVDAL